MLGAALTGITLSQSRSVLAATIAMIVIFALLEITAAGRWRRTHLALLGSALAVAAISLPWLIKRFAADPGGGARSHVLRVAMDVIRDHPWVGVGPNDYVAAAGAFDRLTASGVPVHNIALLSAAELGVLGAVLLWLPFAVVAVRAGSQTWRDRGADQASRALVSALPGIVLIAMTGWGLLQGPYFLIFALLMGYFGARVGAWGYEGAHGRY